MTRDRVKIAMSLTAMFFCLKCSSCQTEVAPKEGGGEHGSVTPQRDHHAGWCWSHNHQVPHHRTVSGRGPGVGVETHNMFSPLQDTQQEGRPIMESQRVRYRICPAERDGSVVWNDDPHSEAQTALTLLSVLAKRVRAVPIGAPVPAASRQHRWSPLFVPLLWGAAGVDTTTPVLEMLVSTVFPVLEPIQFHGSDTSATEAVRVGWTALRDVLRTWWMPNCSFRIG